MRFFRSPGEYFANQRIMDRALVNLVVSSEIARTIQHPIQDGLR